MTKEGMALTAKSVIAALNPMMTIETMADIASYPSSVH